MEKVILENGLKLLYEKVPGDITSFTIGFEAGANVEGKDELGLAHVVEHMVFKGTNNRSEKEINDLCNEFFGFHNAMTNYPYVVYYGSCLKEDFKKAFDIYFDVVFNPAFKEEGFKEEISVILEELKEWSDDVNQHCEDMLFYNSFKNRRIKELIIGREDRINSFELEDLKQFYNKYYTYENCVISVVTSLSCDEVKKIINNEINNRVKVNNEDKASIGDAKNILYENPREGVFVEENKNINGCKMQYIFPIHELNPREVTILQLFNEYFASGTSSLLYDEIRTKRGLVYDIQGKVKSEKGIKLYSITLSTSKENLELVKKIISEKIEFVKKVADSSEIFNQVFFDKHIKSQKIKRMLSVEKSIVLSMNLAVYEIMHGSGELLVKEFDQLQTYNYTPEVEMKKVIDKVFVGESIGIITN